MLIAIIIIVIVAVILFKVMKSTNQNNEINNLMQLANQGDSGAQYQLGYYYFTEVKDIDQAVYWICLSEYNGNEQATYFLQRMIEVGVPRIYERIENARTQIGIN
ncbi:MAG: hypothetical protein J6D42_02990 [Clostridia bacterium]|nr:hypothetical protein [Clostridia bacterium]